jgi:hypothetical protein
MEGYRETEMCSRCQGQCCSLQPGHCLPSDFGSAEAVKEALVSAGYTIVLLLDWNIMHVWFGHITKILSERLAASSSRRTAASCLGRPGPMAAACYGPESGKVNIANQRGYPSRRRQGCGNEAGTCLRYGHVYTKFH